MNMGSDMLLFVNLLIVLIMIISAARVVGKVCLMIGQPRVLGEMVAGVLLGPTLFGAIAPEMFESLFTPEIKTILYMLSNLGLALYMFLVGVEVNFKGYDKKFFSSAGSLAMSAFFVPLLTGICLSLSLMKYFGSEGNSLYFSLFVGIAFSMTAFPMLARILQEQKLINTKIGATTLLSASIIDVLGWLTLAILIALVETSSVSGGILTIIFTGIFTLILFFVVKPLLKKMGDKVEQSGLLTQGNMAMILLLVLIAAAITDFIGVYSVFGGFMLGLVMPKNQVFQNELNSRLEHFVIVFLVPIFFAYSGINTHFSGLSMTILLLFLLILIFAVTSKYFSSLFVMKSMGYSWRDASAVGSLMNARGLMELIVLNVGLSYGLLSQNLFTILVWMAIITTALAMPLYKSSYSVELGKRWVFPLIKYSKVKER
ncbi:cation:proton antiporter domain-containing protein [Bacillus haikouensis]|uniref:cation:proton antiporter domain-containing protein n=1 Tax=Bacillus haikouensis TaxID=1510468 RepID=UPI0028AAA3F4|nr:cation:proton antiporter [Bacillus haikouensis]